MKHLKLIKLNRLQLLLLGVAFLLAAPAGAMATKLMSKAGFLLKAHTAAMTPMTPVNAIFTVRSYGGKCMEYGQPSDKGDTTLESYPVFINECNGTVTQQIRVEELTDRPGHLVILRAGNRVIGVKTEPILIDGDKPATLSETGIADQTPLETQVFTNSPGQIFALDGDSIILAADRDLVVEVQNNRGANFTPLVIGRRDLADAEFWDFIHERSSMRPTSGFISVSTAQELAALLPFPAPQEDTAEYFAMAKPGTVIEVDPLATIELTGIVLRIPTGVTLRGGRRGLWHGAELWTDQPAEWTLITIDGDDVRVTGLLLTGTSGSSVGDGPTGRGINAQSDLNKRVIIDHNELWKWPDQAVDVWGDRELPEDCKDHRNPKNSGIIPNVRVTRNFIHHNRKQEAGYGVESHYGGFPLIDGNTFLENRHAIMADGKACTKYYAWHNLVLESAPCQKKLGICIWHTHDFDVHGTGDNGFGGQAGQYFDIGWNTFLGDNRENFDLRGEPSAMVEYHHNISLRDVEDAVACSDCGGGIDKLKIYDDNQFDVSNPANRLGVGDFDGDGLDDLFLATGAAWYYAPAGQVEWRFLNVQPDKIGELMFGDFDADGRTDVFTQHESTWDVSWGGASKWEKINEATEPMSDYHVADFIGDERADVFYASGSEWYFSDGGVGQFTPLTTSGFRIPHLRFGDFDADGKTDVFCIVTGKWQVSYGGTSTWTPLGPKLTDSVDNLVVADFDGDGHADVATSHYSSFNSSNWWKVSLKGTSGWIKLRDEDRPLTYAVAVGRFDDKVGADVLLWTIAPYGPENFLEISTGGSGDLVIHSHQDMR